MKIFIVRGSSGYEASWIAKAFTSHEAAEQYIVKATAEAKALIETFVVQKPVMGENEHFPASEATVEVVDAPCSTNWATLLDPNFYFDGNDKDDFGYSIIQSDLIG